MGVDKDLSRNLLFLIGSGFEATLVPQRDTFLSQGLWLTVSPFPAHLMSGKIIIPATGWELRAERSSSDHSLYPRKEMGSS